LELSLESTTKSNTQLDGCIQKIGNITYEVFEFLDKSLTCPPYYLNTSITRAVNVSNVAVREGQVTCNNNNMKLTTYSQELGDVCGKKL